MFNGIIKNTGKIKKISKNQSYCFIEIYSKLRFKKNDIGSSISCSGVCLTLDSYKKNLIKFYVSQETLKRTIFKSIKTNDIVNLEKSLNGYYNCLVLVISSPLSQEILVLRVC